jgi:hypothetical protein
MGAERAPTGPDGAVDTAVGEADRRGLAELLTE